MTETTAFEEINEHYLGQRLMYHESQPSSWRAFSTVSGGEMFGAIKGAVLRGSILAMLTLPLIFILTLLVGGGGLIVAALLWCAAWIVPWFIRDHVYAGHWEFSVEEHGHLVEPAFALTGRFLLSKRTSARIAPRKVRSEIAGNERYYLTVKQGRYTPYIGILGYGSDLFVSWSMWREQLPFLVIWYWAIGLAQSFVGKGSQFHEVVRADPARAMREAVHNATRAGVEAAIEGQHATIAGTFGQELSEVTAEEAGRADWLDVDLTPSSTRSHPQPPPPLRPTVNGDSRAEMPVRTVEGPRAVGPESP